MLRQNVVRSSLRPTLYSNSGLRSGPARCEIFVSDATSAESPNIVFLSILSLAHTSLFARCFSPHWSLCAQLCVSEIPFTFPSPEWLLLQLEPSIAVTCGGCSRVHLIIMYPELAFLYNFFFWHSFVGLSFVCFGVALSFSMNGFLVLHTAYLSCIYPLVALRI